MSEVFKIAGLFVQDKKDTTSKDIIIISSYKMTNYWPSDIYYVKCGIKHQ